MDSRNIHTDYFIAYYDVKNNRIISLNEFSEFSTYLHKGKKIKVYFKGELLDYTNLLEYLKQNGYAFSEDNYEEIVATAFLEFGIDCFNYLTGKWFSIIKYNNLVIFNRDRLGQKNLFYTYDSNNCLCFSDSLDLISSYSKKNSVSKKAIELYLALGFVPAPFSIYENVFKLEAGEIKSYNSITNNIDTTKSIYNKTFTSNHKEFKLKQALDKSVLKRIKRGDKIITLMSGGVDSTIITSIINNNHKLHKSYFVDFEDNAFSEKSTADYLAKRNNIQMNTLELSNKEIVKYFEKYYEIIEEPFDDFGVIPFIAILDKIPDKDSNIFTGDGGDELFFGYPHYFNKFVLFNLHFLLKYINKIIKLPNSVKNIINAPKNEFESNYLKIHGILSPFASNFVNNKFNKTINENNSFLRGIIEYDRAFFNWPEKYLYKIDRTSSLYNFTTYSPFVDEDLINYTKKINILKLFTPYSKKLILKITLFKHFGLKYFIEKKRGFTPPIENLRNDFFGESDFLILKNKIRDISTDIFKEISNIEYNILKKDRVLFDRIFFLNEWFKANEQKK